MPTSPSDPLADALEAARADARRQKERADAAEVAAQETRRPSRRYIPTEAQAMHSAPLVALHAQKANEEQVIGALFILLHDLGRHCQRLWESTADPVRHHIQVGAADIASLYADATTIRDRFSPGGPMHEIADRLGALAARMRSATSPERPAETVPCVCFECGAAVGPGDWRACSRCGTYATKPAVAGIEAPEARPGFPFPCSICGLPVEDGSAVARSLRKHDAERDCIGALVAERASLPARASKAFERGYGEAEGE